MSVYLIAESKIIDPKAMENYRKHSIPSALKYGGKYIVAGSLPFVLEGEKKDRGMVVIEFPSKEKVLEWHHSPEYAEALKFKDQAMVRNLYVIEGIKAPE